MSEKELNKEYIRDQIQGICQDCAHLDKILPIINNLCSERYIAGLKQGKFDAEMEKQSLIKYLEDKIEEIKAIYNYDENEYSKSGKLAIYQEILDKIKEGNYER